MNPYWDNTFWQFFATFAKRMGMFLFQGGPLAADEVQFFVLGGIALSFGLLGPFLVLKRITMLANSLSHTILLGIVVSYLLSTAVLGSLLIGAFVTAFLTVLCTGALTRFFRLQEDASIGLVFTSLFALGIVAVTLFTRDVHLGVEAIMGNADALRESDIAGALWLALMNATVIALFFRPLRVIAFDESLAKAWGLPSNLFQLLLLFLTAASCIASFRAIGVLLVLSFLVGPYLIARLFSHRLGHLVVLTPLIGVSLSFVGIALARHFLSVYGLALSTGGIISLLIALVYIAAHACLKRKRIKLHEGAVS